MITSHCYSPPLQALFNASISRGWISYEEINTCLPDEMLDAEEMDLLLDRLDRSNVTFIDQPTVEREERHTYFAPLQCNLHFKRDPLAPVPSRCSCRRNQTLQRRSNWVKTVGPSPRDWTNRKSRPLSKPLPTLGHAALTTPSECTSPKWAPFRCSPGKKKFGWPRRSSPPG